MRQYLPKHIGLIAIIRDHFDRNDYKLNKRPRGTHGFNMAWPCSHGYPRRVIRTELDDRGLN